MANDAIVHYGARLVSTYNGISPAVLGNYPIGQVLSRWSSPEIVRRMDAVASARAAGDKAAADKLKFALPSMTPSGTFSRRADEKLLQHSGLISLDYDKFTTDYRTFIADPARLSGDIFEHPAVYAVGVTSSKAGIAVLVAVEPPPVGKSTHEEAYNLASMAIAPLLPVGIERDGNQPEVARLRFAFHPLHRRGLGEVSPLTLDAGGDAPVEADAFTPLMIRAAIDKLRPGQFQERTETSEWLRWGESGRVVMNANTGAIVRHGAYSGGLLGFIQHERQCDKAAAIEWLRAEGLLPKGRGGAREGAGRPPVDYQARAAQAHSDALDGRADETADVGWHLTAKGGIRTTSVNNAIKALSGVNLSTRYRFNHFSRQVELASGELFDADDEVRAARRAIETNYDITLTKEVVYDGIIDAAKANGYNPITDYLDGLEWDGIDRLSESGRAYFGTDNTELQNAIARCLITGAAARALKPGIHFPYMITLQGAQGVGKSGALKILARGYFAEGIELTGLGWRKALQERIARVWINEVAELDGLGGAAMSNAKSLVTDEELTNRTAFARDAAKMNIHTIFVATTNATAFLSDYTGLRRFPVLECKRPLWLRALEADLDQLYAQAVHEWREREEGEVRLPAELWDDADEASSRYQYEGDYQVWVSTELEHESEIQSYALNERWRETYNRAISPQEKSRVMAALGWRKAKVNGKSGWRKE